MTLFSDLKESLEEMNLDTGSLVLGFLNEQIVLVDLCNCAGSASYKNVRIYKVKGRYEKKNL
jgi:hypothetical protein